MAAEPRSEVKISVVTASYNQGPFISRCIESVRREAEDVAVEHIILDSCSVDQTGSILEEYERSSGTVELNIIVEKDDGQTGAINRGLALSTGDVVCWLNTDEWYSPGALKAVTEYFSSNPEIDVVFGDCDFFDVNQNLVSARRESFFSFPMLIFYGCFIPSCSTFVRRRVLEAGIFLDPNYKIIMDTNWYARIHRAGFKFGHLPRVLANFTWHDTNISANFPERKRIERRIVADEFGDIPGPRFIKALAYEGLRRFWQATRVLRRLQRSFSTR